MVGLLIHYMAPIMFMALVVFLLLGYPVAFSLGAVGLIFGLIGIEVGLFRPDFLQAGASYPSLRSARRLRWGTSARWPVSMSHMEFHSCAQ